MQNEQAVKMAAKLYECRDTAKSVFGDGYHERMAAYGQVVKSAANALGCSDIAAATTLANKAGGGMAAICYLAAVVEMTEPSNYHIDANNSGAWKRVLRDVKAATLPEVLRAIDALTAACPGTSWRVVDATTERTLDRSALDASGHTEWAARHVHQGAPAVAER